MTKSEEYVLWEIYEAPTQKTDRDGGLGSTGVGVLQTQEVKRGRGRPRKVA